MHSSLVVHQTVDTVFEMVVVDAVVAADLKQLVEVVLVEDNLDQDTSHIDRYLAALVLQRPSSRSLGAEGRNTDLIHTSPFVAVVHSGHPLVAV